MAPQSRRALLVTLAAYLAAACVVSLTAAYALDLHSTAPGAPPRAASDASSAPGDSSSDSSSPSSRPPLPVNGSHVDVGVSEKYDRQRIEALLVAATVVDLRPHLPGYDRDCSPGAGCSFGPAWTDSTSAPDGHNGCDTRNDVLGTTLQDVVFEPGSQSCDVIGGHFIDPYTGIEMDYASEGSQIHIDHLIPLAAAWDLGAANWAQTEREQFANDTRYELLAANGGANESKGDSTPASWLPPNRPFRCEYVGRYLEASAAYLLPITRADATVIGYAARKC